MSSIFKLSNGSGAKFIIKEIISLAVCLYVIFHLGEWKESVYYWELGKPGYDTNNPFNYEGLFVFFIVVPTLWFTFRNYFVWNLLGMSGFSKNSKVNNSIENIKYYRNVKMNRMPNEDAADLYRKTSWIDNVENSQNESVKNTKHYINAKLGRMSNEDGLKWLKGEE
jgi:hypothetical protein